MASKQALGLSSSSLKRGSQSAALPESSTLEHSVWRSPAFVSVVCQKLQTCFILLDADYLLSWCLPDQRMATESLMAIATEQPTVINHWTSNVSSSWDCPVDWRVKALTNLCSDLGYSVCWASTDLLVPTNSEWHQILVWIAPASSSLTLGQRTGICSDSDRAI